MKVLKFGGTSVGSKEAIAQVVCIVAKELDQLSSQNDGASASPVRCPVAVVASAFGGGTDQLRRMGELAAQGDQSYLPLFHSFHQRHMDAVQLLEGEEARSELQKRLGKLLEDLQNVLKGALLVGEVSLRTMDLIMSFGERLSCLVLAHALAQRVSCLVEYLDARELVKTDTAYGAATVIFEKTDKLIREYFEQTEHLAKLQVITGFLGSTESGETVTLGRGGSDFTASIFGAALRATEIQIWTDVEGVFTADPRKVPRAFPIPCMSYEETMEMAHFGAKVIYPPTMAPAMKYNIPIRIKNTFKPELDGTIICDSTDKAKFFASSDASAFHGCCGISSIDRIALLNLQGCGMIGVAGVSKRLFGALAKECINIILISQASSEHSICIAIAPEVAHKAKKVVEKEFELEIFRQHIDRVDVRTQLAIIALVGENMQEQVGISARLFGALSTAHVNVVAIAQGSSEHNISTVIKQEDTAKGLQAIHSAFFASDGTRYSPRKHNPASASSSRTSSFEGAHVYLMGIGGVGSALLRQIAEKQKEKENKKKEDEQDEDWFTVDIKVVAIANSRKMLFSQNGISLDSWDSDLQQRGEQCDLSAFLSRMKADALPNSVFVDCTSNAEVATLYHDILSQQKVHVVAANKKANSSSHARYLDLKRAKESARVKFLYETNVGAGLPVISTLQALVGSGDKVISIEALLSGTLSYIFSTFSSPNSSASFSEIVKEAQMKGYTEPDPREDLSGMDVGRKLLILARECGLSLEMEDISVENLIPLNCRKAPNIEFFTKLKESDAEWEKLRCEALQEGKALRYVASLNLKERKAKVSLQKVGPEHNCFPIKGSENVVVFRTQRYDYMPLVIKGPGGGFEVTAAGVFADINRIFI
ncbi:Bifunctional aspartate kinase/homoserine dehydrogenase I [Balamuthia mandrillaris]